MSTLPNNVPIKKEPVSSGHPSDSRVTTATKPVMPPGATNFRPQILLKKNTEVAQPVPVPIQIAPAAFGKPVDSSSGAAPDSSSSNNMCDASGGSHDSSGFKRRDNDTGIDGRSPKVACNHDLNGIFNGALKDIAAVIDDERNKHAVEMRKAQIKFSEQIDQLKSQHADEIKKIFSKHAAELEAQSDSFARELNKRKAGEQAEVIKQKEELEKEYGNKIELLEAKLVCAERTFHTSISAVKSQLEEQERNHYKATIKNLTEVSEKRIACITEQHKAEQKAAVAEVRAESQGLIAKVRSEAQASMASLKATLAERDAHLASMKKFVDSLDNIRLAVDGLATLPQQIASLNSHSASFTSQAQMFQSQIQQLQGFLSAWQSNPMNRPGIPIYWNQGPPPRNCNPNYPPAQ